MSLTPPDISSLVSAVVREVLARGLKPGTVALGADHGGFKLKEHLKTFLTREGYIIKDCGTFSTDACDYPDIAKAVAREVKSGASSAGIMIDGAGIGSSMVCNKFRGVRAANCHDVKSVLNSRQHNNANVLTLGAGVQPVEMIETMVKTWLETPFEGGRHTRRVEKIEEEY